MASRIAALRRLIAVGRYELTGHGKEEMEYDGFTIEDVKHGVYSGRIVVTQKHGPGRRKYVIRGSAIDGRPIWIVCRTTESGRLRIITVFGSGDEI
jgi:hypothetical protein